MRSWPVRPVIRTSRGADLTDFRARSRRRNGAPLLAGRVLVVCQRLYLHRDAISRGRGCRISAVDDSYRIYKVLVQMIHVFADAVFQRRAQRDVVEDREVLDVFAQPDAARVGAD